jgi:hypothetical protein
MKTAIIGYLKYRQGLMRSEKGEATFHSEHLI